MNTLDTPLISTLGIRGPQCVQRTLPGVFAALSRDEIGDFPALRPHQRHVWHAFLVQIAALALLTAGKYASPKDERTWRKLLLDLTPEDQDGAAWSLVSLPHRPGLLQAAVPEGDLSGFKLVRTPDLLDILITSRNHDLKAARLATAEPQHWLFALLSLQTQEGFLGSGNYGISRMNGGFANRPGFGIEPGGGPGVRFRRDLSRLLGLRAGILRDYSFFQSQGGLGLVWLLPWDGKSSLSMSVLDPYYVEICRRARLVENANGSITALTIGSKVARIESKALRGNTGDPWTPLIAEGEGWKALTLDANGLSYRRLVPLMFPKSSEINSVRFAPLQAIDETDADEGLTLVGRALVRGQGKTMGYYERRVPISKVMRNLMRTAATDRIADCACARVKDAGLFGKNVLYPAIRTVFSGGRGMDDPSRGSTSAQDRAMGAMKRFERGVDVRFFEDLDKELEVLENDTAAFTVRGQWLMDLRRMGQEAIETVIHSAPPSAVHYWRIKVAAHETFNSRFSQQFHARIPDFVRGLHGAVSGPAVAAEFTHAE